jgi:transcriptional regulator with PAS, ATPase and Fis domain
MALSHNGIINIDMLPDNLKNPKKAQIIHENDNEQITPSMEEIEKAYIHWILVQHGFQKQKAAEVLGIGRSTLDRKIEKYGLDNA